MEAELASIVSIKKNLESVLNDFKKQTLLLVDIERRVHELEKKFDEMEADQNKLSVMYS